MRGCRRTRTGEGEEGADGMDGPNCCSAMQWYAKVVKTNPIGLVMIFAASHWFINSPARP